MGNDTKICENCDTEVGVSETACPKCHIVFEDMESEDKVISAAMQRIAKRQKKIDDAAAAKYAKEHPEPVVPPKPAHFLASLARLVEEKKAGK